jgi:hypothetical protein
MYVETCGIVYEVVSILFEEEFEIEVYTENIGDNLQIDKKL